MKRRAIFLAAAAFAGAAFAQSAPIEDTLEPGAAAIGAESTDADVNDRHCLKETGSRITASQNRRARKAGKQAECANAFGRAYDREDIERTGATDVKQALQMLDPSIHRPVNPQSSRSEENTSELQSLIRNS